jgi:hypothetical protein
LRLLRPFGQDRVDRDHRDPRRARFFHRRHDSVDVDGDDDHAIDFLLDVRFDGAVLRGRVVVGVEDDQLVARLVGGLLRPLVDLVKEERLLVVLDHRIGLIFGLRGERSARQRGRRERGQERPSSNRCVHHRCIL